MTEPAIIEAAARALNNELGPAPLPKTHWRTHWELRELAEIVLTAATPLIEAAALERAAKVAEEHFIRTFVGVEGRLSSDLITLDGDMIALDEAKDIANERGQICAAAIRALIVKDSGGGD